MRSWPSGTEASMPREAGRLWESYGGKPAEWLVDTGEYREAVMDESEMRSLLEPALSALGVDLEDLDVSMAGRRRRVCVVVDRDGGVDLDLVASVSKAVSQALDSSDSMGEAPYVLEVTSPGADRPLTEPRHWRRAQGRKIDCQLRDGSEITGRLTAADDECIVIVNDAGEHAIDMADLARGIVVLEFRREGEE